REPNGIQIPVERTRRHEPSRFRTGSQRWRHENCVLSGRVQTFTKIKMGLNGAVPIAINAEARRTAMMAVQVEDHVNLGLDAKIVGHENASHRVSGIFAAQKKAQVQRETWREGLTS